VQPPSKPLAITNCAPESAPNFAGLTVASRHPGNSRGAMAPASRASVQAIQRGADVFTLQTTLGHSSTATNTESTA